MALNSWSRNASIDFLVISLILSPDLVFYYPDLEWARHIPTRGECWWELRVGYLWEGGVSPLCCSLRSPKLWLDGNVWPRHDSPGSHPRKNLSFIFLLADFRAPSLLLPSSTPSPLFADSFQPTVPPHSLCHFNKFYNIYNYHQHRMTRVIRGVKHTVLIIAVNSI